MNTTSVCFHGASQSARVIRSSRISDGKYIIPIDQKQVTKKLFADQSGAVQIEVYDAMGEPAARYPAHLALYHDTCKNLCDVPRYEHIVKQVLTTGVNKAWYELPVYMSFLCRKINGGEWSLRLPPGSWVEVSRSVLQQLKANPDGVVVLKYINASKFYGPHAKRRS
jgi:hypothetical protein